MLHDKDGNGFYEITDRRRVTLSKFRGKPRVDIREFYSGGDGALMPSKKGLSMSLDEYKKLKTMMPLIDK